MFQDISRPQKREVQRELSQRLLFSKYKLDHGSLIGLCGPNPYEAISQYPTELLDKIVLCEADLSTYITALKVMQNGAPFHLEHRDIFDIIEYIAAGSYMDAHQSLAIGLDLDFCRTLSKQLQSDIIHAINALFRHTGHLYIWARITASPRGAGDKGFIKAIENIKSGIVYKVDEEYIAGYRDTAAMQVWQGVFVRGHLKQGEVDMKKNNERTLKQLSETERLMVQILASNTGPGMEMSDIQKHFKLRGQTMAALKAWETMRRR